MSTIIIGFGYKARRGKDTACEAIMVSRAIRERLDICKYAFADALREEVNYAVEERFRRGCVDRQAAMRLVCAWAGVEYDPNAVVDGTYLYGKQRALLQWWGTEYRRTQDDNYWVKRMKDRIERDAPEVAIISDLRFPNEFEFIQRNGGYCVRVDRPGFEIGDGKHHISEVGLDTLSDDQWDHIIVNDGSELLLKGRAVKFFDQVVSK